MSATSPTSEDSNAERDHEYAPGEFNTEPEITYTAETESEPEPRVGNEAESRFSSGAEASSSSQKDDDLFDKGRLCPHAHYFNGEAAEYEAFCQKYHIPDDVFLNRVRSDKLKVKKADRPGHITVPLMAICEAGLRFPLHPFLREVLWKFSLCTHQLAINSYRIIMSVIALIEMHNLDFRPTDLFHTYTMSRHGKSNRRFLTTRAKKTSLVDGLSDTDKWANLFLEVSGNFEFGEGQSRNHPVQRFVDDRGPKVQNLTFFLLLTIRCLYFAMLPRLTMFLCLCFVLSELGPISRTLNTQSREAACETLLAIPVRHAPTLLDYKPSYKGVLKKKEKKKEGEPDAPSVKEVGGPSAGPAKKKRKTASGAEGTQKKRQPGVKLPKIGYTLQEWLSPLEEDFVFDFQPTQHNAPLQISEPTAEDMSRRNIPRPPIPTKTSVPGKGSGGASDKGKDKEPVQKKQKTAEKDPIQPNASDSIPVVDSSASDPKEKELLKNPHIDLTNPETVAAIQRPFSPSYAMPDGRIVLLKDSVKEEPNLAVTLLKGLALPRDCDQVPSELLPGLAEMCSHLVQVRLHPTSSEIHHFCTSFF
jgi:hypothetical protein